METESSKIMVYNQSTNKVRYGGSLESRLQPLFLQLLVELRLFKYHKLLVFPLTWLRLEETATLQQNSFALGATHSLP